MSERKTIYLDDAIDIVEFESGGWIGLAKTITDGLKQLPSAEPEVNDEWRKRYYQSAYNQGFIDGCKSYEKAHPTESQNIICENCKHWEQTSICEGHCNEIDLDGCDEDFYCAYAERKTNE